MSVSAVVKASPSAPANGQQDSDPVVTVAAGGSHSFTGASIGMAANVNTKVTVTASASGAYVAVDGGSPTLQTVGAGGVSYTGKTVVTWDAASGESGGHGSPPPPPY